MPAFADIVKVTARDTAAAAAATPEFPAHQIPAPSEIPTNIGILISECAESPSYEPSTELVASPLFSSAAGVVFLLLFAMCLQDHRKRARITDSYKDTNPFS